MRYEHLVDPTPDDLTQVQRILETNLPPSERKPFPDLILLMQNQSVILLVAREQQSPHKILGTAFLIALPNTLAYFLLYLAVDKEWHGQGIGTQLFEFITNFLTSVSDATALVWEVEKENPNDSHDIRNRRIRFYKRLGAQIVTAAHNYFMPDLQTGDRIPLWLMYIPLTTLSIAPDIHIISWISAIYTVVYSDFPDLRDEIISGLEG